LWSIVREGFKPSLTDIQPQKHTIIKDGAMSSFFCKKISVRYEIIVFLPIKKIGKMSKIGINNLGKVSKIYVKLLGKM